MLQHIVLYYEDGTYPIQILYGWEQVVRRYLACLFHSDRVSVQPGVARYILFYGRS